MTGQQNQPKPEPVRTSITVVENISAETPANVSEITPQALARTPGVNLDDRLREIPGFSLFRRTSSVVANPTTQGVSLRGIGSSGASRSLVLWDGVPVNDPFGGWIYWTRFAPDNLQRVEISRGASTSVFGDLAMGGAISLFSSPARKHYLTAGYEGGNRNSQDVWAGYSELWSRFALSGSARAYSTGGYYVVPENVRGSVDRPAGVRFVNSTARLDLFGGGHQFFAEANILAEERPNGTLVTQNSTSLGTVSAHYLRQFSRDGFSILGFQTRENFHSAFSAIAAGRNSERLTFRQTVPSNATGAAALWSHSGGHWNTVAGADVNRAHGIDTDVLFPTGTRAGGGTLLQHGVFVQSDFSVSGLRLFLGARHQFTGQDRQFFSPSAGAAWGRGRWRTRGSVYRGFRAPTLNELYREFRVGNAVTQANAALRPETLFGAEAGVDFIGESSTVRMTVYRNALSGLITNVTLSSAPNLIVRQRQNAADSLSRGAEFSADKRWRNWRGELGYLYADSRYATGPRIPQVPRHQGSAQVSYEHGRTLASLGFRSYASQFDDDLNKFLLPGFATLQLVARERLARNFSATLAFENLLNREYLTGFTPTPTIGAPRLWRVGLRWEGKL
ncbi:MAG: TonB-dependent receptor [Acidobacteriota bacterium]|nr:TonB-dependent receptor [Acidobacteriota bacterium]